LAPLGPAVRLAFVFGSVAQGKERPASDVDVTVVGKAPFARIVEALVAARERLRREVNPVVMGSEVFRSKLKARDRFVSRFVREPKIFLVGDARELAELAENRAA
jgi:predicted nucleotidyltransferase